MELFRVFKLAPTAPHSQLDSLFDLVNFPLNEKFPCFAYEEMTCISPLYTLCSKFSG